MDAVQSPEQIAAALEQFLAEFPQAVLAEDGKVLFDFRDAKYTLSTEHGRCTLHLWSEERNLVRRVSAALPRAKTLRLTTHRFGQSKPSTLEVLGDKDRRTPSTREATRNRFVKTLERVLERHFEPWRPERFRTAMDLEKSFGPAYARGVLTLGARAWAVIGVNQEEAPATIDGILTFGILWMQHLRDTCVKQTVAGLRVIVPRGSAALTLSRMSWLAGAEQFALYELDEREGTLEARDAGDQGNLQTRLHHAPNLLNARTRFAEATGRILALVPEAFRDVVEPRLRTPTELAFLLHGLEFARVRLGASAESFNRVERITFGAGPAETELTAENEDALTHLVARLCERRSPAGERRDPLFRMQPERWLEGEIRRDVTVLDAHLDPGAVYTQVPAFAAADRGMLDLLGIHEDGRLAVMELKAEEDPQLAMQGLDYWIRVRWHHAQNLDAQTGLGEFQRHGYFGDRRLALGDPRLYLAAPALRIHPATEVILRHFSPRVEWTLIGLDERWRVKIKAVWKKRSSDAWSV